MEREQVGGGEVQRLNQAIQAAMQVAGATKWTEWKGLPGNAKLYQHLRDEADWKSTPVMQGHANKGNAESTLAAAAKKLSATYQLSYMKHAPIGPTMAVADVKADGTVHIIRTIKIPNSFAVRLQ